MKDSIKKSKIPFTQISNKLLNDDRISLKAKGIYAYMYSKTDDWNFTIKSMSKQLLEGMRSISSALSELKQYGWVSYEKNNDGSGVYHFHIEPELQNDDLGNPNVQNPNLRNRNLRKRNPINNIDNTNNKDCYNSDSTKIEEGDLNSLNSDVEKKKKRISVKCLFRNSIYKDYDKVVKWFINHPDLAKRFSGVDVRRYIENVEDWNDKQTTSVKRTDLGWIKTIKNFMQSDLDKYKLIKLDVKKSDVNFKKTNY